MGSSGLVVSHLVTTAVFLQRAHILEVFQSIYMRSLLAGPQNILIVVYIFSHDEITQLLMEDT